jgi:hypothetical protein
MHSPDHPLAKVGDEWIHVRRTGLTPTHGLQVPCSDGPTWIVDFDAAQPLAH